MTVIHYNITALKASRLQIISVLKTVHLQIGKHFTVSAARTTSKAFELKAVPKSKKLREQIAATLRKQLKHSVEIKDQQGILRITLGSLYSESLQKLGIKGTEHSAYSKTKAGRKKSELGLFKDALVQHIESETNARLNGAQIGFRCTTEHIGKKQTVILHCAERFVVYEIVRFLEEHEGYQNRIVSVQKHSIAISFAELHRAPNAKTVLIKSLYREFQKTAAKVFTSAPHILTPRTLAVSEKIVSIEVGFATQNDAVQCAAIINQAFSWTKEGNVLKLSIALSAVKKVLGSVLVLDKKSKHGLVAIKGKQEAPRYVHLSMNYQEFHFLPFNRTINKKHVRRLVESIESFGPQSFVNIAETDCVDGVMRKWIVDGQHRFMAYQFKKMPILYTISKVSTKEEMVRLIAVLNHTAKTWHLRDYLRAWCQLGIRSYVTIENALTKTRLPITVLLELFSGQVRSIATDNFQQGKYHIRDLHQAETHVSNLVELKPLLPRSSTLYSALAGFFNSPPAHYSNRTMKERLKTFQAKKRPLPFGPEDNREELIKKLDGIYKGVM